MEVREFNCMTGVETVRQLTQAEIDEIQASVVQPTVTEQLLDINYKIEEHADLIAKEKEYKTADRCVTYAGYANPYQTEATAFAVWRTACFDYFAVESAKMLASPPTRIVPTPDEFILELNPFVWPV